MKPNKVTLIALTLGFLILVPCISAEITLLEENFESSWLPNKWDTIITNSGTQYDYSCTWSQDSYTSAFHKESYGVYVWWSYEAQDEWLITPSINLTQYEPEDEVLLGFSSAFYRTSATHAYVCISHTEELLWSDTLIDLDTFTTWVSDTGWVFIEDYPNTFEYDISVYIGQIIRIGFNYYWDGEPSLKRGSQSLDDIWVTVDTTAPEVDSLDLRLRWITLPQTEVSGGLSFPPTCIVEKNLDTMVHAKLSCQISKLESQEVVYSDSMISAELDSVYTTCTFKGFIPERNKLYEILFSVEHPDDLNAENDTLLKTFGTVAMPPGIEERPSDGVFSTGFQEVHISVFGQQLQFTLEQSSKVNLIIYDVLGRKVTCLATGHYEPGLHTVKWDTEGISPGIYFARLTTARFSKCAKVIVY